MAKSNYVIPFSVLINQVGLDGQLKSDKIELTRDQLLQLIRKLLALVQVDEEWYRKTYPDVERSVVAGATPSAKDHFVSSGYFEGRRPGKVVVDETFYINKYPDVAEGIEFEEIDSAQEHFDAHGYLEGRLPFDG
jgi:hypothetical protein